MVQRVIHITTMPACKLKKDDAQRMKNKMKEWHYPLLFK
jgi:hypothetical protein